MSNSKQWEYETVELEQCVNCVGLLREKGEQGWELVSVTEVCNESMGTTTTKFYFKREKK